MSATISAATTSDTKFWVICREENQLTQRLAREINHWQISGLHARLGHQMSLSSADAIAQADYAIFVTLEEHPGAHIRIQPIGSEQTKAALSPAAFLNTLRKRHGRAPQAWWLQLPTTEIRPQGIKHIPTEQTLSKAITQIEVFVRNYYLRPQAQQRAVTPSQSTSQSPSQSPSQPATAKQSLQAA
ncbi:MAG: hypothetical protein AAGL17_02770 [Cyanobacteria bacterium J06576_12]